MILHSRNPAKLDAVAASLKSSFPARTFRTLVADAARFPQTSAAYDQLVAPLCALNITMLVNNVGNVGAITECPMRLLADWEAEELEALVNLNVSFSLQLTRVMLPVLKRCEPALIVNCGSVAAAGLPYIATYSGTKAVCRRDLQLVLHLTSPPPVHQVLVPRPRPRTRRKLLPNHRSPTRRDWRGGNTQQSRPRGHLQNRRRDIRQSNVE